MRPLILLVIFISLSVVTCAPAATTRDPHADYVVLLHGAGKTHLSMKPMEVYLHEHGYRVINLRLHSAGRSIEQMAEDSFPKAFDGIDRSVKIHFVTHSMGAIILREYLSHHDVPNLGRVVMLGPPNHGSEFVDWARPNPLLRFFLGPRVMELGTRSDDLPSRLGPIHCECGVVAGDRSYNPLSLFAFRTPNDGKVTVESTRISGMRDFIVLHSPHAWLIWQNQSFRQTMHFLKFGEFDRAIGISKS